MSNSRFTLIALEFLIVNPLLAFNFYTNINDILDFVVVGIRLTKMLEIKVIKCLMNDQNFAD